MSVWFSKIGFFVLGLSPWAGLSFKFYVFVLISSGHFFLFSEYFQCKLTLSACKEGVCFYKVPVLSDLHHLYGLAFCQCGSCLAAVCYVLTGVCYKAEDHVWLCLSNFLLYGSHKPMLLKCSLWREWNSGNKSLGIKEMGWGWMRGNSWRTSIKAARCALVIIRLQMMQRIPRVSKTWENHDKRAEECRYLHCLVFLSLILDKLGDKWTKLVLGLPGRH